MKGIPSDYYVRMHAVEERHWWHRGMREVELALLRPRLRPGARLLDGGCGTGGFLRFLLDRGAIGSAAGIDLSPEAIELARERVPEADLGVGSVTELPFEDETFDAAVLNDVLQHVPSERLPASVGELRSVGGIGEKCDRVGTCARQRADTSNDLVGCAVELTAEFRGELA